MEQETIKQQRDNEVYRKFAVLSDAFTKQKPEPKPEYVDREAEATYQDLGLAVANRNSYIEHGMKQIADVLLNMQ